jgi:hypothetical protein
MRVDQNSIPFAPDNGDASSRFGWLSAEEISAGPGGEPEDHADSVSGLVMPSPASPIWPRVYPGL